MTVFTTFVSLTRFTAMLAAGTFLLAAANGASNKDGVVEVPAVLNPDKLLKGLRLPIAWEVSMTTVSRVTACAIG